MGKADRRESARTEPAQPAGKHEHHDKVVKRLARIEGHVGAIKRMVEQGVPCPDLLVQISAVLAALKSVGRVILEDHLQSCMVQAVKGEDFESFYNELKESLKRFIS
jgi:DNA-binding FrmR family transcriptional regulator